MPIEGSSNEILNSTKKKRANKKRQQQQRKFQSKTRLLDGNDASSNGIKNGLNCSSNRCDLNKLTPANLASLRWDNILTDPILENERIERYKELRRQRYTDARQHTIQTLLEQMQMTPAKESTNLTENEQQ